MDLYKELLENDLNPYLLFNNEGKLKAFNKEAEFLMNFVSVRELFDISLQYASKNFGFNKQFIHLKFDKQAYYAIVVGYFNEDEIALRLFKEVSVIKPVKIDNSYTLTNIFTLLEISRGTTLIDTKVDITEVYDISIPEFKVNVNDLLLVLNAIFEKTSSFQKLTLKVKIKIGEYEMINNIKYKILSLVFRGDYKIEIDKTLDKRNRNLINIIDYEYGIKVEIPIIV